MIYVYMMSLLMLLSLLSPLGVMYSLRVVSLDCFQGQI